MKSGRSDLDKRTIEIPNQILLLKQLTARHRCSVGNSTALRFSWEFSLYVFCFRRHPSHQSTELSNSMGASSSSPASTTSNSSVALPIGPPSCHIEQKFRGKKKVYQSLSAEVTPRNQKRRLPTTPWTSLGELTRRMKQHLYCYSEKNRESPTPHKNRNTPTGTENLTVDSRHCVASPPLLIDNSHSGHISGRSISAQVATSVDYAQRTPVLVNTLGSAERQLKCVSFLETQRSSAAQAHPNRCPVPTSSVSSSLLSNRPSLSLSAVLSAPLQLVRTSPKPTAEPDLPQSTLSPQSKPTPPTKPMVLQTPSSGTGSDSTQTRVELSLTFKHMGNVARIPLNRSHSRTSPYDRSHRSTSPEPSAVTTQKEPNGLTDNRTSAFHLPHQPNRPRDLDIPSPDSANKPSMPLSSSPRNDPYSEDSPTRRTQSPDLSLCSLASDDLMLDTGLPSPVATPDSELDIRMKRDKFFGLRDSMVYSRLESVTELSHDDLSHPEVPELREMAGNSRGHCSPIRGQRDLQQKKLQDPDSPICICPSSANCDCKSCEDCSSFHNRRRRTTVSVSGSFGRFSLRRLRSRPRSLSYSQAAASLDPSGNEGVANLGDRTFYLLGTDQRQMLQELQSVKTTLLRLRRLLSEDQWHLPVFHEQLRMTEPTKSSHIRPSLPPEWLSPLDSDASEPSSHLSSALGHQQMTYDSVSREPAWVDNKGDMVSNKSMEMSCRNADGMYSVRSPRFSVDSDVVTKLVEVLSGLIPRRLTEHRESQTREEQAGLHPAIGCIDHIYILRQILEHLHCFQQLTACGFLVSKADFDSVDVRHYISATLRTQPFTTSRDRVKVSGKLSPEFTTSSGVMQGCCDVEVLLGFPLTAIEYSDSIAVIGSDAVVMQTILDNLNNSASWFGMRFIPAKCKVLLQDWVGLNPSLMLADEPIEVVKKCVYLGICISPDSLAKDDISIRIVKASATFVNLLHLWCRHDISLSVKGRFYDAAVPFQRLLLSRFATNGLRERLLSHPDGICRSKLVKPIVRHLLCVVKNDGYSRGTCCYYQGHALPDLSSYTRSLTHDVNSNNPEDWHPIYRLKTMPYIQAASRLKFLLTTVLLVGTPPIIFAAQYSYVSSGFTYFFVGSTIFSLCTLAAFSYYSTKLIGVYRGEKRRAQDARSRLAGILTTQVMTSFGP
ncbi:hypothetical protein T265_08179 [Opisthorchis viverrini]|uniref:Reverse transcriptase domain-containing protein n=1 Tax=Opisthorchis viverrini TaxID=6198 RepID=A0A074ZL56_OPIVI|nr:hypothetical protein T265_08179 [Opisthorchis viverrini]KER24090.1 hypothetical protein T265_08179 [Opisthorchis viverrini]